MEDERIIQLFFNRSEMAIKELHHKYEEASVPCFLLMTAII